MFEFKVEQKTYDVFGVKIGGRPGESPTVMIGSIFYRGQKLVLNGEKGVFIKEEAEKLIKEMEVQTEKTGLPSMIDLVAENAKAAEKYLDFVTGITRIPILLDIPSEREQIEALKFADEQRILDRIILNSLNPHTNQQMFEVLKNIHCKNAILLLYDEKTILSSDKTSTLEKLVLRAEEAQIKNLLIDTVVLDIPTLGIASNAIYQIKDKYGYPAGCGAHNAIHSWKSLNTKFEETTANVALGVANAIPVAFGADFVLYGPIENAKLIYPSIALMNTAYSQLFMEKGKRPSRDHPRYRIG